MKNASLPALICAVLAIGCGGEPITSLGAASGAGSASNPQCLDLPLPLHATEVAKDGIPALTNPAFSPPSEAGAHLHDATRVVGVVLGGDALAIPLDLLWWHEIVNIDRPGLAIAVTYCPLTGSALAFDRHAIGGGEFRVSGLLYDNNLVMFDRSDDESLWAQMAGQAICGSARGRGLPMVPSMETSLGRWLALHPGSEVATRDTGHDRNYDVNPYEDYWRLDAPPLIETDLGDSRRLPKERILGIPASAAGGLAVPFLERAPDAREALNLRVDDTWVVVLWDGDSQTAVAHFAFADWPAGFEGPGGPLSFAATESGYVDDQTGTLWNIEGAAIQGPGAGALLARHTRAYVAFWFAWSALRPETAIFAPGA